MRCCQYRNIPLRHIMVISILLAGFVIALGNFEGTFYRYAKHYEAMQAWAPPASPPLRRPDVSPAASAGPAQTADKK